MTSGAGRRGRRGNLVHENPPALVPPFPLHQVPRVSLPVAGADLVHEIPPALISPFPLHQVPRVSSPAAGANLVHEIPPALVPPFPLHQVPRVSSPVAGADLVHEIPLALVSPFPLHQVSRISSPVAGRAWCLTARYPLFLRLGAPRPRAQQSFPPDGRGASPPANPCFFVLGHHVPEHSSRSRRAGVVPHRSLALVFSS